MRIPPDEKFVCNFRSMERCANGAALHHLEQSTQGTFTNREGHFLSERENRDRATLGCPEIQQGHGLALELASDALQTQRV